MQTTLFFLFNFGFSGSSIGPPCPPVPFSWSSSATGALAWSSSATDSFTWGC